MSVEVLKEDWKMAGLSFVVAAFSFLIGYAMRAFLGVNV